MLLALGIGLSLALALTRPQIAALGLAGKRTVAGARQLAVDGGAHARRTQPLAARTGARAPRAGGELGEVMLLDTMGTAPVSGFVAPAQALAVLERLAVGAHGDGAAAPADRGSRSVELHLFSDGVALADVPPEA